MAITLPLPLRVAAGLVATGIDLVKSLPEDIPALPVTLVGNAMRLSMKFQQEITTLATRGDELLGGVIGAPQENPPWAKFDDDEPVKPTPTRPKAVPDNGDRKHKDDEPAKPAKSSKAGSTPKSKTKSATDASPVERGDGPGQEGEHQLTTPTATATAPADTTAMEAALEVSEALVEQALEVADADTEFTAALEPEIATEAESGGDSAEEPAPELPGLGSDGSAAAEVALDEAEPVLSGEAVELTDKDPDGLNNSEPTGSEPTESDLIESDLIESDLIESDQLESELIESDQLESDQLESAAQTGGTEADDQDGPAALPGYSSMTLAQVRGHLRELSADDVGTLLQYEQGSDNRPPFLTLLSNRLVTLDTQNQ